MDFESIVSTNFTTLALSAVWPSAGRRRGFAQTGIASRESLIQSERPVMRSLPFVIAIIPVASVHAIYWRLGALRIIEVFLNIADFYSLETTPQGGTPAT